MRRREPGPIRDTFAADLRALIEHLDLRDAAVVGFSMGRRRGGPPPRDPLGRRGRGQPSSTEGLRASLLVARRQWNHQATASPIPRSRAVPTPTVIHSRSIHSR